LFFCAQGRCSRLAGRDFHLVQTVHLHAGIAHLLLARTLVGCSELLLRPLILLLLLASIRFFLPLSRIDLHSDKNIVSKYLRF
jgi:hypothetical protein